MAKHSFTVVLPSEQDLEDPHSIVYTALQREWIELVIGTVENLQQSEMDGASSDITADRLREDWECATAAMERFAEFAERHTRRLSPGPGESLLCILCENQTVHREGAEFCVHCIVSVLATAHRKGI